MAKGKKKTHFFFFIPKSGLFHINYLSEVLLKRYILYQKLSLENNCLLWGLQTVIPRSLQARLFTERHKNHLVTAEAPVAPLQGWTGLESVATSGVNKYKTNNSNHNLLPVTILYSMK